MRCFWDERQRLHAPTAEFFNGKLNSPVEHQGRTDAVLAAIGPVEAPRDFGMEPIRAVHSAPYLDLLQSAFAEWRKLGRDGDAFPYTFPILGQRKLPLKRLDARLGQHSFDTSTPIGEATWEACYWSAQTALTALDAVLDGERTAFAFTRPPGHHAAGDYLGGYSYLNTAAIAAEAALAQGRTRVAILDVDYHHGNGTQDIFYARKDVAFASIHADPSTDYPFFWGAADEQGDGEGWGATLNLPLPRGTDWSGYAPALTQAVDWIERHAPELLIVSYGADTYAGDPISYFELQTSDYAPMARRIASLSVPTLIVMEGGYAVDALGANVAEFLSGF
jgi:acetoin utilization deacetylase AcuC-like enzyme